MRGYNESKSNVALCHLDAISETQENADVHIYDQNRALMEEVCTKWNASVVNDIEDVLNANFDVVLIASPDSTHAYYIQLFSNAECLVVCEKPLAADKAEFNELLTVMNNSACSYIVNYSRVFASNYKKIKDEIDQNKFGELLTVDVRYGKGLTHNGSHAIHLLNYFFGELEVGEVLQCIDDFSPQDKTYSFTARIGDAPILFLGYDHNNFEIFEIDIIFSKARVVFTNFGDQIELHLIEVDDVFSEQRLHCVSVCRSAMCDAMLNLWSLVGLICKTGAKHHLVNNYQSLKNLYDLIEGVKTQC